MRDAETAQIAVQASLTGHLVLSTVHTNDAVGAITRLRDMGVESFLLASTLRLIVAQRLVRRLCEACKTPVPADAAVAALLGIEDGWPIYRAAGCAACNGTGYVGRVGVYEAIKVDDRLRRLIGADADEDALARAAFSGGGLTLTQSTRAYVLDGITTAEEAVRVARQETGAELNADAAPSSARSPESA